MLSLRKTSLVPAPTPLSRLWDFHSIDSAQKDSVPSLQKVAETFVCASNKRKHSEKYILTKCPHRSRATTDISLMPVVVFLCELDAGGTYCVTGDQFPGSKSVKSFLPSSYCGMRVKSNFFFSIFKKFSFQLISAVCIQ